VKFRLPGTDVVRLYFSRSTEIFFDVPRVQFIALPSFGEAPYPSSERLTFILP